MGKNTTVDTILNDAKTKAFKKAHLPKELRKSYKISIKSGRVVLEKKSQTKS